MKRLDYINWDEYFMGVAILSAKRSKDPSTQVGACIADQDNKVVSLGYNGMPRGISDDDLPWNKGEDIDNKYLYVCHAEFNAILNTRAGASLKGCRIYVTLFPCNECAKAVIQTGISEIIYLDDKYHDDLNMRASRHMLTLAGVKLTPFKGKVLNPKFDE